MRAPKAFDELNGRNWCALAVAIWSPVPLTVEDSFAMYETGRKQRAGDVDGLPYNRQKEAYLMQKAGLRGAELDCCVCLNHASHYAWKYIHGKG